MKGPRILVVAPASDTADSLTYHLASLNGWAAQRIELPEQVSQALLEASCDAVVFEYDPASPGSDAGLASVITEVDQRPVVVVADTLSGSRVAGLMRFGAADYAPRAEFDEVVAALERSLSSERTARRSVIVTTAAEAVRSAAANLDQIFTEIALGMALVSLTGTVLRVNRKLCEISGRSEQELLGSDFQELAHPDDAMLDHAQIFELLSGAASSYEVVKRYFGPGGEIRWVDQAVSLAHDADGEPLYFIAGFVDVTPRQFADAARDNAIAALEEAQRIALVGSWKCGADGQAREWSHEQKRIFGLPLDAPPPTQEETIDFVDAADRERVVGAYQLLFETGEPLAVEFRITAADGSRRTLRALGRKDPLAPDSYVGTIQDITELRAAERGVQEARELFRRVFDDAPVGMCVTDLAGHFLQVNTALCELVGYPREDLQALRIANVSHPEELTELLELRGELSRGERASYTHDFRLLRANGEAVWTSRTTSILEDSDGQGLRFLTHFVDITERHDMEHELRHLADHDPLTGLLNRRGLEAVLDRHVTHVNRYGDRGALLVLDLDHFKTVNDTLGHEAGDRLIVSVASVLRTRLRASDTVARLGGDEFAILLPDANIEMARRVAEQIVADIHERAVVEQEQARRHVTVSIGVTTFRQPMLNAEAVLVDADLAMYDAKEAGRDQVAVDTGERSDEPRMKARLEWINRLRAALDHGQFTLYAQPIRQLDDGAAENFELLLRMVDDRGETIPPGSFLYIAERYGMIQELDEWVARQAIALLASQPQSSHGAIGINISAKSLTNGRLLETVRSGLREHQVEPNRLIFEVAETTAIAQIAVAREFAERLRALGCGFALDDFGSGFGGLFYLKHMPFDFLKIDRQFVTDCLSNTTDQLVIKALVSLAHELGKRTVAEGVEDYETELFLRHQGVDLVQGYFVGRPVPINDGASLWSLSQDAAGC